MKNYLLTLIVALVVGLFLSNLFINQYKDYNGIKVSNSAYELYFIQYGVYSSIDSMEKNTISLENYVYNEIDGKYYVYIGITKDKLSLEKIENYYKKKGINIYTKTFSISNKKFLELIDNFDKIINSTDDSTTISSIINQTLIKYEEVVINGS